MKKWIGMLTVLMTALSISSAIKENWILMALWGIGAILMLIAAFIKH